MNAREIATKRFEKSAFGYKPEEVDSFLRDISNEFANLQKEKDDCEKKIEVLADKVRDYMQDEEALKEAILSAQRQGRQVVEESKMTANRILAEANEKAQTIVGQTSYQLQKEKESLAAVKKEVSDFKSRLFALYKSHFEILQEIPDYEEDDYPPQAQPKANPEAVAEQPAETQQEVQIPQEEVNLGSAAVAEANASANISSASPFQRTPFSNNEIRHTDLKFGSNNK